MELTIQVVSGASERLNVLVSGGAGVSVLSLKQLIEQQNASRFPVAAQRLIFQGQILQDDKLLSDYNISAGMALHLTLAPGVAATIAAAAAAAPQGPSTVRAAFASMPPSTRAPSPATLLRQYLQQMQAETGYETAIQTMQKICENIVGHPTEDKYRKLRMGNAALKARLFDRSRGMDCLKLLGFQEGIEEGHLVLVPNAERWETLTTLKRVVDEFATTPAPSAMFGSAGSSATGGFPTPGGAQGNANNFGNMAAQASAMLQNPMMAQMISNHPMMQQMAQSNPMIAQAMQNPALLQQMLGSVQSNPMMMQQINQMMSDPSAMQAMLGGGGGGGLPSGFPSFGAAPSAPAAPAANPFAASSAAGSNPFAAFAAAAAAPPAAAPAARAATPAASSAPAPAASASAAAAPGTESYETYDEDEIAQAIARSLEEH